MQIQMPQKIEMLQTEHLVAYSKNSRTHSDDQVKQIASSMREFGFTNPILIDENGGIIAGHGRVMAAKHIGLPHCPCLRLPHLTDAQKRAYVIADNKLALNAGWDNEILSLELADLKTLEFDLGLTGFSDVELNELLALNDATPEGNTDEDAVPEAPEQPITVLGDVWSLGKHRLMCGDSTSADAVSKLCFEGGVDMWITDPPYNVDYTGKGKDALKIQNDSMSNDQFRIFLKDCYAAANSVMRPGAVFYIWHSDVEGFNFRGAAADIGWQIRQCLIWVKQTIVIGRQDYHWKHEPCLYGWKAGAAHFWASDRKQSTVLNFDRPSKSQMHPTMKPINLIEYQVKNNSKAGDVVLDSFGGSGSTLIACEKTGRINRSMELDPKYCDVIIKRWQEFTGKEAVHEGSGKTYNQLSIDKH